MPELDNLQEAVRHNCHVSDSLYARNYGLCTYLLKMRELYRWEKGLPLTATLPHDDVGEWLTAREQLWDELEQESFRSLPLADVRYDPFASHAINRELLTRGLVYGGGYGPFCKPTFFMGRLEQHRIENNVEILVAGEELVRDLSAPPAMSQGDTIVIRRESVRRALWERIQEWEWHTGGAHTTFLMDFFTLRDDPESGLDAMTEMEIQLMLAHEMGEIQAGRLLGEDWEQLLLNLEDSRAELVVRAVRDHLADCLTTLPELLARREPAPLFLYFSNLKGMRRALFPALEQASAVWQTAPEDFAPLEQALEKGRRHWQQTALKLLEIARAETRAGQNPAALISRDAEKNWTCG